MKISLRKKKKKSNNIVAKVTKISQKIAGYRKRYRMRKSALQLFKRFQ